MPAPSMILGDFVAAREPFPAGQYVATCYGVANIGTHATEYQGQVRVANRVVLLFEIPELRYRDKGPDGKDRDRPKAYSVRYALSLSDKSTFRKHLEAWRGKPFTLDELKKFNVFKLVGAPAYIQIVNDTRDDGSVGDKLTVIMPLPRQIARPKMENPPLLYAFDKAGNRWPPFPDHLPEWLQHAVKESKEWEETHAAAATDEPPAEPAPASPPAAAAPGQPPPPDGDPLPF